MKLVLSAFPGTGKSTIFKRAEELGLKPCFVHYDEYEREYVRTVPNGPGIPVFDSDSSLFDKAEFPGNYIKHIKETLSQDWMDDVIILVSSHDNVREALREAGIEYHLAFPQLELKADYIERYKHRGSPEAFVNMMEEKWVDFIESCLNDPIPGSRKAQLSEGAYLVDYLKLLQGPSVDGNEDASITAAIIDTNANAEDGAITVVHVEPTTNPEATLLNVPEGQADATLDALEAQMSQPAADPDNSDPQVHGNEEMELPEVTETLDPNPTPAEEHARSELIEAKFDMENDIDVIERVIVTCQDETTRSGLEGYEDNGPVFTAAVENLKVRYKVDVEPTLAGMEGFLDQLKDAFNKLTGKLKDEPTKQQLAQVKKYLYEAEKAFAQYGSDAWQSEQKFINVGKTKLQVPALLQNINSPADIITILKLVDKRALDTSTKYLKNTKERMQTGIKIFNTFKGKSADTPIAEVDSHLPIKPEEMKGALKDSGLEDLDVKLIPVELPVLNKDGIKEVCKLIDQIVDTAVQFIRHEESLIDVAIPEDDFYDSAFWDKHLQTKQGGQVWDVTNYFDAVTEFSSVGEAYNKKVLNIAKFLEQWVLHSVK